MGLLPGRKAGGVVRPAVAVISGWSFSWCWIVKNAAYAVYFTWQKSIRDWKQFCNVFVTWLCYPLSGITLGICTRFITSLLILFPRQRGGLIINQKVNQNLMASNEDSWLLWLLLLIISLCVHYDILEVRHQWKHSSSWDFFESECSGVWNMLACVIWIRLVKLMVKWNILQNLHLPQSGFNSSTFDSHYIYL